MTPIDLIWIFIVLSTVEPMLKQSALAARRASALRALERCRGSLVTGLIHRRETGEEVPVNVATALSEGRWPPDFRIDVKSRGLSYDTPLAPRKHPQRGRRSTRP